MFGVPPPSPLLPLGALFAGAAHAPPGCCWPAAPPPPQVMQNLGYFQLSAGPGVWSLALAPGRGAELFEVLAADPFGELGAVPEQAVEVTSFEDSSAVLRVRKRRGKEKEPLLEALKPDAADADAEGPAAASFFGSLKTTVFGGKPGAAAVGGNETMHVFSLATGHLYERFLKVRGGCRTHPTHAVPLRVLTPRRPTASHPLGCAPLLPARS